MEIFDNIFGNFNFIKVLSSLFKLIYLFPIAFLFAAVYSIMTLYLFYRLGYSLILKRGNTDILALLLFFASWFISGFAGIGGVRYFISGYPFLIIASFNDKISKHNKFLE